MQGKLFVVSLALGVLLPEGSPEYVFVVELKVTCSEMEVPASVPKRNDH